MAHDKLVPQFATEPSEGVWRPLREADMSHRVDAVSWWNSTGRGYGARAPEVRNWMLDSNNYYLDHYSINRSQGAMLGQIYLKPLI
nr:MULTISPECIES: HNH/ENDO VII family nuclease [unclassified Shewanella]